MDASRRSFLAGRPLPAVPPGAAVLISPACLARHGVECRVCGEACDRAAIRFPPRRGGVAQPAIEPARCTLCGDCVAPCPVGAVSVARA
ncbi:MAG: 4Fe-4S dicluster domain-containing protein [Ideonella sp.]|nr:4Fe-4S dicluster domain-containing protein [Ideonella sp.]